MVEINKPIGRDGMMYNIYNMQPSKKQQWDEKALSLVEKEAHSNNIIGIKKHTMNTFLTSSEDKTVRLWDLRLNSSVKLIRNQILSDQLSNPETNGQNAVYVGSDKFVYQFDLRQEQVFVEQIVNQVKQQHYDSISQLKYSPKYEELLACDDEGDLRFYTSKLQCMGLLDQTHKNICTSIDYLHPQNKPQHKLCVSGGFDSTIIVWNMHQQSVVKQINLQQLMAKHKISIQNYPFIHGLYCHKSWIIAAQQNGYILCWSFNQLNKPKFIMPASLTRIVCCRIAEFNEKILLTASIDGSFSLFDFLQRKNGEPTFLQKYTTSSEPTSMETIGNKILIGMSSPKLGIYSVMG